MATARSTYVDALKGYAILLVVVGHALQRAQVFGLYTSGPLSPYLPFSGYVTMPLFFAVSGYLTYGRVHEPVGRWLLGKARMLLIPLVVWTVIYYFTVNDGLIPTDMSFVQYLNTQATATSLWFLLVLFYCYVLVGAGTRIGDWALPLIGVLLVWLLDRRVEFLAWYWGWFVGGYFYSASGTRLDRLRWPAWVAAVAVYVIGIMRQGMSVGLAPRFVFALTAIGLGTLFVYALRGTAIERGLAVLGARSMSIYVGQFLFVQLVFVHSWANAVITTVLAVAGSLLIDRIFSANRWTNVIFLGGRGTRAAAPGPQGAVA